MHAENSRALKNKYGIDEGKVYKPWLRVPDVKSNGVRSKILGLKTGIKLLERLG